MKHKIKSLILILFCFISIETKAQLIEEEIVGFEFELNLPSLRNSLLDVPVLNKNKGSKEQALQNGFSYQLPTPEGIYKTFKLIEAPILSPDLAKEFPDIKTYRAYNLTDDTYGGRITISDQGLHGNIFTEQGEIIIKKDSGSTDLYRSFYERELDSTFDCGVDESLEIKGQVNNTQGIDVFSNGTVLKTYRMAVVTTGEFFNTFGASQVSAMIVVTTKVNALSAFYEKEVGITFTVVATKIYEDSATDGLDPGAGLADEALNKFNVLNGSDPGSFADALYDIGHVFHDSGGGVAYVGVICDNNSKGGGWSGTGGSSNKVLYHEVGHMFTGRHSFNSISSGCSGNITTSSAFEPGSGSTIMSYFGNCSPDNLSGSAGNYFHTNSLEQIISFSTNTATCFSSTASGNTAPVVNANPSGSPIVVPKGTPFTLVGSGTDANGEVLMYTWEQLNLGTTRGGASAAAGTTDSPIFRSYAPSATGNSRTFPNLATILSNGAANLDEALPQVARTLTMQLTGRDNNATAGGTHSDQVSVSVNAAGPFELSSHSATSTIAAGAAIPLTWNVNGTAALSANVKISLSIDGGQTFPFVLAATTANDGSDSPTIPAYVPASTTVRIKISSLGTVNYEWFDLNNADLTVTSGCLAISSYLCPLANVSGQSGNAIFNLGLTSLVANEMTGKTKNFSFTASTKPIFNYTDNTYTTCQDATWSPPTMVLKFRVTQSGIYTVSGTTNLRGTIPSSLYNSSTFSCASFLGANSNARISWSSSYNVTLNECTDYWVAIYDVDHSATTGSVTFSGPGDILELGALPGGFSYTYAAFNVSTGNIAAVSSTANFTSLAGGAAYAVKGLMYVNAANPNTFVAGTEAAAYNAGSCILFSNNKRYLFIAAVPCPNTATLTVAANIAAGTSTFQTDSGGVDGLITATNVITGGNTTYDAGKKVVLSPGFSASNGAVFQAQIGGCTN